MVPRLRTADGKFATDATEKKKIVSTFFASLWDDKEKLHGEIPDWVNARWNTEVLDLLPLLDGSMILSMALKMGKGQYER